MPVNPATQSLQQVVDVTVTIGPQAAPRATFNEGLILGTSTMIPSVVGTNPRIRKYTGTAQMLTDGFAVNSPEYLAALAYFGQSPAPDALWVGRQDVTVGELIAAAIHTAGAGYHVGDVLTVSGGTGGTYTVDVISGTGAVLAGHISNQGTEDYTVADNVACTGGNGTNFTLDVTAVTPETPLQAFQACRAANFDWYAGMSIAAAKADHEAIAAWIQSATPSSRYFYYTADADVPNGIAGNVFLAMQAATYSRVFGIYATTQLGVYPNQVYMAAAVMGVAMGRTNTLANSAYTMKFKSIVGMYTEPLTPTQILNIEQANGNCYISYGNFYNWLEQGKNADGSYYDEGLYDDMLANEIQLNIADLLNSNPKVPDTDQGVTALLRACDQACENLRNIGYIAPKGNYTGIYSVLNLNPGDALPRGFLCQAPSVTTQSAASRAARESPPIYVTVLEAGAVHSVTIQVNVQR